MASKVYLELYYDYGVSKDEMNESITEWVMSDLYKGTKLGEKYSIIYDALYKFMNEFDLFDSIAVNYEDYLESDFKPL